MIILGLTGSIGMGKTTVAKQFAGCGASVFHADDVVHALMARPVVVKAISEAFPGSAPEGKVDRKILGKQVFAYPQARQRLEALLHPLVREERAKFLENAREKGARLAILDIPLLFETGGEKGCDYVVVVTAAPEIQKKRVLERQGMTEERFQAVLATQMPDAEKRQKADFIVHTDQGLEYSLAQVHDILRKIGE